jgi:hypothetical protein
LENELAGSIRFIESLNIAALQVPRPVLGNSYGIAWKVPPPPEASGMRDGERQVIEMLLGGRGNRAESKRRFLKKLFGILDDLIRKILMPDLTSELQMNLMVWSEAERVLVPVAGAWITNGEDGAVELVPNSEFRLKYGDGVAGKALKYRKQILWQRKAATAHRSPDFYKPHLNGTRHEFLICFPLRRAGDPLFAVLCVGSSEPYEFHGDELDVKLDMAQDALSQFCLKALSDEAEGMWGV